MSSHEYRALMAGIGAMSATTSVVPAVEQIVGAALIAAAPAWFAVAALRRERRIRDRLADPHTRPAAALGAWVPTESSASAVREGTPS